MWDLGTLRRLNEEATQKQQSNPFSRSALENRVRVLTERNERQFNIIQELRRELEEKEVALAQHRNINESLNKALGAPRVEDTVEILRLQDRVDYLAKRLGEETHARIARELVIVGLQQRAASAVLVGLLAQIAAQKAVDELQATKAALAAARGRLARIEEAVGAVR